MNESRNFKMREHKKGNLKNIYPNCNIFDIGTKKQGF